MPDPSQIANDVAAAQTWDARIAMIRRVPETFGTGQHAEVYAAIAARLYGPTVEANFAYVHWRDDYELEPLRAAYDLALSGTARFTLVGAADLARLIEQHPQTLRVFRLLLGLITPEFVEACSMVADAHGLARVGKGAIEIMEAGGLAAPAKALTCATTIHLAMTGGLVPPAPTGSTLRRKIEKPDTADGWPGVRAYAASGVPLPVLLHQRAYGGAFRQLLDATSSSRGNVLEEAVEELFRRAGVPFLRTGSHDQAAIAKRFGLTVKPAPDFVIFDARAGALKAILECKLASDGGTARDKAARFRSLRVEANRLGGVPVIAVLGGRGWRRIPDALGPVVRDTDGRTFTMATFAAILDIDPFPSLRGQVPPAKD